MANTGGGGQNGNTGGLDMTAMLGDGPKPIEELFPVTLEDPRTGRQYWHESAAVTEAVAKELFDRCSQPPPVEKGQTGGGGGGANNRARVLGVQMSLGKLMGHPAITGGREKRVDVDDALWLFMRHWLVGGERLRAVCILFASNDPMRYLFRYVWQDTRPLGTRRSIENVSEAPTTVRVGTATPDLCIPRYLALPACPESFFFNDRQYCR